MFWGWINQRIEAQSCIYMPAQKWRNNLHWKSGTFCKLLNVKEQNLQPIGPFSQAKWFFCNSVCLHVLQKAAFSRTKLKNFKFHLWLNECVSHLQQAELFQFLIQLGIQHIVDVVSESVRHGAQVYQEVRVDDQVSKVHNTTCAEQSKHQNKAARPTNKICPREQDTRQREWKSLLDPFAQKTVHVAQKDPVLSVRQSHLTEWTLLTDVWSLYGAERTPRF